MAGNLRGITVEIGGDTTKLGKALEGVNSKSRSLQNELKGVNTLLKMDPGNVTLLTQKQTLLTQAINQTKEKLGTLKEAQKQAQAQFEKGEITEEQYRDLQREIVLTEQKLEGLTDEAKNFGSVGAQQIAVVGDKVQEVGGKVENFGKKFSLISAGTGAILAGSMSAFVELDEGYDTIVTKTGATGDALEGLNTVADNLFSNMPVEMADVGVAVGEINTRFGHTGGELEKLSTQFLQFAEINGVDLNNSIGTVDKILEQFNMDASEAGGVLDLITLKAQQTGIGADTLMNSIQQNGSTFKDMGIGVNEAVVLLSQFEANGVNVETALKGLKKATVEYADEGLSMEEGLSKTINSIKNAKTETEALSIASEIFGTKGAGEMTKAIREGRISVEDLSKSMGDYSGVVSDTFEGTLDPIDQGKVAMNNLKLAGSELGGQLQSVLAPMLTTIVEKLKTLVSWFSNLSPGMQTTIVVILSIVTAIGPLIIIIGKLITSVGTIMSVAPKLVSAFNVVKTAFSSLGTAFASNPIGIIVVAITTLVAGFIYLWNNCEGFRNFWIGLWENIKSIFFSVCDALVNFFTVTIPNAWNGFITWLSTFIDNVVTFFSELPGKIWTWLVNVVTSIATWGQNLWTTMSTAVSNAITNTIQWFQDLPNKIGYAIGFVIGKLILWGQNIANWIKTNVPIIINNIVTFFKELPGKIWTFLVNVVTKIGQWGSNMLTKAKTVVSNVITSVVTFFKELPGKIWTFLVNVVTKIGQWGSNMLSKAKTVTTNVINSTVSFFKQLPGKIWSAIIGAVTNLGQWGSQMLSKATSAVKNVSSAIVNTLKSIPSKVLSIGKDIVTGLWNGIKNAGNWIKEKVSEFAKGILKGMKDALGIKSPSRKFRDEVGAMIVKGLAQGIEDNRSEVQKAMDEMNKELLDSEKKYNEESERLKDSKSEADKAYLETLKETAEKERKIYDAKQKDIQTAKENILDSVKALGDESADMLADLEDKQNSLSDKLKGHGELYTEEKRQNGWEFDEEKGVLSATYEDVFSPADLKESTAELEKFADSLLKLKERADIPSEFFAQLRDMSVTDGTKFSQGLLELSDEELNQWLTDWQNKQTVANQISATLYQDEAQQVADEIGAKFKGMEDEFLGVGENSAEQFGVGFFDQLTSVIQNIKSSVRNAFSNLLQDLGDASVSVMVDVADRVPQMAKGGIVTRATRLVAGEDGAEAIIPLENNTEWINKVARQINDSGRSTNVNINTQSLEDKLGAIYDRLDRMQIVLDSGALIGETIDKIDDALANKQLLSARGV